MDDGAGRQRGHAPGVNAATRRAFFVSHHSPRPQHDERADDRAEKGEGAGGRQGEQVEADEAAGNPDQRRGHDAARSGELPRQPSGTEKAVIQQAGENADDDDEQDVEESILAGLRRRVRSHFFVYCSIVSGS